MQLTWLKLIFYCVGRAYCVYEIDTEYPRNLLETDPDHQHLYLTAHSPRSLEFELQAYSDVENTVLCSFIAATSIVASGGGWTCGSVASKCTWPGVNCVGGGYINSIYLTDSYTITGTIPSSIGSLTNIETFVLATGNLGGSIPSTVGNMQLMSTFAVVNQKLTGTIPSSMYTMSKMVNFQVYMNSLQGTLPSTLGSSWPNLVYFLVFVNSFAGQIPVTLWGNSKLILFQVHNNAFTGSLPSNAGSNFGLMNAFYISTNKLTGTLPSTLGSMTALEQFIVAANSFVGTIPPSLFSLSKLLQFQVHVNALTGTLPANAGSSFTKLNGFYVSTNKLAGSLPSSLNSLTALQAFVIAGNSFVGKIPSGLWTLTSLVHLQVYSNLLTGSIPATGGSNFQNLNSLYLHANKFTGTLPTTLGSMTSLEYFIILANSFQGTIPSGIWSLTKLLHIQVQDNSLIGTLPPTAGSNLVKMQYLFMSRNSFAGTLPATLGSMTNLLSLQLSSNAFTGTVPSSLAGLVKLQSLYLDGNSLVYPIPSAMCGLQALTTFYVFSTTYHQCAMPTPVPTLPPTPLPTSSPSFNPTVAPSAAPTLAPTSKPTVLPTLAPTPSPTLPPTPAPTKLPSSLPTSIPSNEPSSVPTSIPSANPTSLPSCIPTSVPSGCPSVVPSTLPTNSPSGEPTSLPTSDPTTNPTSEPSGTPSQLPSSVPTGLPSAIPSAFPTNDPTSVPSAMPTGSPSRVPTSVPSSNPIASPSSIPTSNPSTSPSSIPTSNPSTSPSSIPTSNPSTSPSSIPTSNPSAVPSVVPSALPTDSPSGKPTSLPTSDPTFVPTSKPSTQPSGTPTSLPSSAPSAVPTQKPSSVPSGLPTSPTSAPSFPPAPAVINLSYSAEGSRAVIVTFQLDSSGELYCLPVTAGSPPPATMDSIFAAGFNASVDSIASFGSLRIDGLVPSSTYELYCASTSSTKNGVWTPLSEAIENVVEVTTSCCRDIILTLTRSSFPAGKAQVDLIVITSEVALVDPLTVQLSASRNGTLIWDSSDFFFPSAVSLTASSWSSGVWVSTTAVDAGLYTLGAQLSGVDASKYASVFADSKNTIQVLDAGREPQTPSLSAAVFSTTGNQITVKFSGEVDKGGLSTTFVCSELFFFADAGTSSCTWTDTTTVAVRFDGSASVVPGNTIAVRPGVLRAACSTTAAACKSWKTVNSIQVTISAPAIPLSPVVSINAPSTVGRCDSPLLDMSASSGSGGRKWASFSLIVTSTNVSVAQFLTKYFKSRDFVTRPVSVPSGVMQPGDVYTFTATQCNFLGRCGKIAHTIRVVTSSAPVVSIQGLQNISMSGSAPLTLKATAFVSNCDGSVSSAGLSYAWTIASSSNSILSPIESTSQNPAIYKLNGNSLTTSCVITVTVTSQFLGTSAHASVYVTILPPSLVAVISGGASQTVGLSRTLSIDASSSYYTNGSPMNDLTFTWSCKQISPVLGPCPSTLSIQQSSNNMQLAITPTDVLVPTSVFVFTVILTGTKASQSSSASVSVSLVLPDDPVVSIFRRSPSGTNKLNPSNALVLVGTVELSQATPAYWTIDDASTDLTSCALTPLRGDLAIGRNTFNLALAKDCLIGRSVPYIFTLSSGKSFSSVPVTVNVPPSPGIFEVSPQNGTAMTTEFLFYASQWFDDDLPLSFIFGYLSFVDDSLQIVQDLSEASYRKALLPSGDSESNHNVSCYVKVYDALGEFEVAEVHVRVKPADLDLSQLSDLANDLFSAGEGNVDDTKSTISLFSTTVNTADDCSYDGDCVGKSRLRDDLLGRLTTLTAEDDVSEISIFSWTTALSAITFKPDELSSASAYDSLDLCAIIATHGATLGASTDSYSGILDALDSVAIVMRSENTQQQLPLNDTRRRRLSDSVLLLESLLESLGAATAREMTEGQGNVERVHNSFRLTSAVTSTANTSPISVSLPLSDGETRSGVESSGVAIHRKVDGSHYGSDIRAVLISTLADLYGPNTTIANPLTLKFIDSTEFANTDKLTFILQNTAPIDYISLSNDMYHNTSCGDGEFFNITYQCVGGISTDPIVTNITHTCTGSPELLSSKCPSVNLKPSCNILRGSAMGLSCSVESFTPGQTVCACVFSDSGRRLIGEDEEDLAVVQLAIATVYVAEEFGTTVTNTQIGSLADLQKVMVVVVLYGVLWITGLLVIVTVSVRKLYFSSPVVAERRQSIRKRNSKAMSAGASSVEREQVMKSLMTYIDEVFPSVYQSKSRLSRLWSELSRHHRYLSIFTAGETPAGEHKRLVTCVNLLTVQTMLMFILAVVYDLQFPMDDGTCSTFTNSKDCQHYSATVDRSVKMCSWSDGLDGEEGKCVYSDPSFHLKTTIVVSVLVAILVAPINLVVDFIFASILSAPTASPEKMQEMRLRRQTMQQTTLGQAVRRASSVARRASAATVQAVTHARSSLPFVGRMASSKQQNGDEVPTTEMKIPEGTSQAHAVAQASSQQLALQIQERNEKRKRALSQKRLRQESLEPPCEEIRSPSNLTRLSTHSFSLTESLQQTKGRFGEFKSDLVEQRKHLKASARHRFDERWGLEETGLFKRGQRARLQRELEIVQEECETTVKKLQYANNVQAGLEVLHLFLLDILGRNTAAAKIFQTKSHEDFQYAMLISAPVKAVAWVAVALLNAFFVYFSMLRGLERGLQWQRMYAIACLIQFVVEIAFYETSECAMVHFMIPDLVSSQVQTAAFALRQAVQSMCKSDEDDVQLVLDVPQYLFVSTAVANRMPHLVESAIIQCYHTYSPGELSQSWNKKPSGVEMFLSRNRHSTGAARSFTVSSIVLSAMLYFGSRSITIQRAVIHLVQPLGVVAIFAIASMLKHYPLYSLLLLPVFAYCAYKIWRDYRTAKEERINHSKSQINVWPEQSTPAKTMAKIPMQSTSTAVQNPPQNTIENDLQIENIEHLIPVLSSQASSDNIGRSATVVPESAQSIDPHTRPVLLSSQSDVGALMSFNDVDVPSRRERRKSRGISMSSDDMDIHYGRERLDLPVRRISRTRGNRQASDSIDIENANEASVKDLLTMWADKYHAFNSRDNAVNSDSAAAVDGTRVKKMRCRSLSSDDLDLENYKLRFQLPSVRLSSTPMMPGRDDDEEDSEGDWEYCESVEDSSWRLGFRKDVDLWVENMEDNMSDYQGNDVVDSEENTGDSIN